MVYVPLLNKEPGNEGIPVVNMLKVCRSACLSVRPPVYRAAWLLVVGKE